MIVMDILITYESIRGIYNAEKTGEQLSRLPDGFMLGVRQWMASKSAKNDTMSLLEVQNAKKLLDDIINRRQRKIAMAALTVVRGSPMPQNMTLDEGIFFDKILALVKQNQTEFKEKILGADFMIEKKMEELRESIRELQEKKTTNEDKPLVQTAVPSLVPVATRIAEPQHHANGNLLKPLDDTKKVKVLIDLPKFVTPDFKEFGPFKIGDVVEVPHDVFNLLAMRSAIEPL